MKTYEIILQQLGGNKFLAMTGAHHLVGDGDTLRMQLPRNKSKANRLWITYNPGMDDYTMRFFHYTPERFNSKKLTFTEAKTKEIKQMDGVYCDMLQEIFTETTGMYTRLF